MTKFIVTTKRKAREKVKPMSEALKDLIGCVTIGATNGRLVLIDYNGDADEVKKHVGDDYHVEPETFRQRFHEQGGFDL